MSNIILCFSFLSEIWNFSGSDWDFAYNIESVLALLGFLMLLYSIAKRLTASLAARNSDIGTFFSPAVHFHFFIL